MKRPLRVEFTTLAAKHIREELERILPVLAMQPRIGSQARNIKLEGVRRVHLRRISYYLYFHVVDAPS